MYNMKRKNNGVTLIALIITIIVLLILAAVSFSVLLGDNGLLTRARDAADLWREAEANEREALNQILGEMNNWTNGTGGGNGGDEDDTPVTNPETGLEEILDTTEETPTEFSRAYGVIEIAWLDLNNNVITNPISPKDYLGGMTPVKWTGTPGSYTESTTTSTDTDWYSYVSQTGDTDGRTSRWANAKAVSGANEAYFVWIPRYAYKIIYFNSETDKENYRKGISTANIVGYSTIHGMVNVVEGDKIEEGTEPSNVVGTVKTAGYRDYIPHPGFEFDGAKAGIWVGKYESAHNDATIGVPGSGNAVKIVPNVLSWRDIKVSDIYTTCVGVISTYGLSGNTHMMKNIEWGAAAYLTESRYGRNGTEIHVNNHAGCLTGNSGGAADAKNNDPFYAWNSAVGVGASTTGNAWGIYDMSGGSNEFVAAYIDNGHEYLQQYCSNLVNADEKFKDIYIIGTNDDSNANIMANKGMKGDAGFEVRIGNKGWNMDILGVLYGGQIMAMRGGYDFSGTGAGVFALYTSSGAGSTGINVGFRVCLII